MYSLPSLRDSLPCFSYPGLTPWAKLFRPFGAVLSQEPTHLRPRRPFRSKHQRTVLARPNPQPRSAVQTVHTPPRTSRDITRSSGANSRSLELDIAFRRANRTQLSLRYNQAPFSTTRPKSHRARKLFPNPPAGHPPPRTCARRRTAARAVTAGPSSPASWR
jgi:hypothetical protein